MFGKYKALYADAKTARIISREAKQIVETEMKLIPSTVNEFKNSKYYVLPSLIRKYQGFVPTAYTQEDLKFKGEQIYLKEDLTELHT